MLANYRYSGKDLEKRLDRKAQKKHTALAHNDQKVNK